MHPEIREFWEDMGYKIHNLSPKDSIKKDWVGIKNGSPGLILARLDTAHPKYSTYFYNDVNYSEEEMLKIIKLKAFL